ncbi:MAG TPA: hypothetical protein VE338_22250 [Ktedonobacterales bacterium]|jgi:hypothetical protein|nr:hypothetical protein [Ktedonobacterales bacterium]
MKRTYRAWVEEGAHGFFLTSGVAVNATRLINPLDRRGGYFVRRDTHDPLQQERRALLADTDKEDGERDDRREVARHRHRHVIAYDSQPAPHDVLGEDSEDSDGSEDSGEKKNWILTHRVERAAEVVRRGWLTWQTIGEVITDVALPASAEASAEAPSVPSVRSGDRGRCGEND